MTDERENPFTVWTAAGGLVVGTLVPLFALTANDSWYLAEAPAHEWILLCAACVAAYLALAWFLRHTWIGFVLRIPGYLMELASVVP